MNDIDKNRWSRDLAFPLQILDCSMSFFDELFEHRIVQKQLCKVLAVIFGENAVQILRI